MEETTGALILLILLAGSIWLQFFLSKKENKWLGLMIPAICFIFSIITVLSLSMYSITEATQYSVVTEATQYSVINGSETHIETSGPVILQLERPSTMSMLVTALPVFLVTNIPTLIFLAIYFACREKLKTRTELDKMNIQDL